MSLEYKIDTRDKHIENLPSRDPRGYVVTFRIRSAAGAGEANIRRDLQGRSAAPAAGRSSVTLSVTAVDNNPPRRRPATEDRRRHSCSPSSGRTSAVTSSSSSASAMIQLLGGLRRVQRATNLLIEAERTTHTGGQGRRGEAGSQIARPAAENWPGRIAGCSGAIISGFFAVGGEMSMMNKLSDQCRAGTARRRRRWRAVPVLLECNLAHHFALICSLALNRLLAHPLPARAGDWADRAGQMNRKEITAGEAAQKNQSSDQDRRNKLCVRRITARRGRCRLECRPDGCPLYALPGEQADQPAGGSSTTRASTSPRRRFSSTRCSISRRIDDGHSMRRKQANSVCS